MRKEVVPACILKNIELKKLLKTLLLHNALLVKLHSRIKDVMLLSWIHHKVNLYEFEEFLSNLDKLLNHNKQFRLSFRNILGDFNARSKSWGPDDVTSHEVTHIKPLPCREAIFREYSLSFPSTLQCSGHPGNIFNKNIF